MAAPRFRVSTIIDILKGLDPTSIVDLGCGGGEMLVEVRRAFSEVKLCGMDLALHQIEENRIREACVDWRVADLDVEQPFQVELSDAFDVVLASEVIEHMSSPDVFLRNARALAKPGKGSIVLSTQSGPVFETERRVGHLRHFSAAEMWELFVRSGWEPIRVWNTGFPFHDLSKRLANIDPDRTMRRFSDRPYTTGQDAICFALRVLFAFNSKTRGAQLFAVARNPK